MKLDLKSSCNQPGPHTLERAKLIHFTKEIMQLIFKENQCVAPQQTQPQHRVYLRVIGKKSYIYPLFTENTYVKQTGDTPMVASIVLNEQNLYKLPDAVQKPSYDRSSLKVGIVQIGPSNFFRGHLATFIDDLCDRQVEGWDTMGICAVSLQEPKEGKRDTRAIMQKHDFLYTVSERQMDDTSERVIGCVKNVMNAIPHKISDDMTQEQRDENAAAKEAVIQRLAHPQTKLVTMTVTQDGYVYTKDKPKGECERTLDYIAEALERRFDAAKAAGVKPVPFTIMSCDNMANNGIRLKGGLSKCIGEDPKGRAGREDFYQWVMNEVPIVPATMVDRIVPGTEQKQLDELEKKHGYQDSGAIFTEKHRQFVIQNTPNAVLPPLDLVGALFTDEPAPYEMTKLRMVNGAHFALGMTARLNGYENTGEAMRDGKIGTFIRGFIEEVAETTIFPHGVDKNDYINATYERMFGSDQSQRLARKSSEKLSPRLLEPLTDAYVRDLPRAHIIEAVALWPMYLKAAAKDSNFDILDDHSKQQGWIGLAGTMNGTLDPAFFETGAFGQLINRPTFQKDITVAYEELSQRGLAVFAQLEKHANETPKLSGCGGPGPENTVGARTTPPQFKVAPT